MKNILLVHGFNGIPQIFEYFKTESENKGYNVLIPKFPTKTDITVEGYEKVFDENKEFFDKENIIVVAHSIGNAMFIKYLSKNKIKIDQYISLAGFGREYHIEGREDINSVVKLINLNNEEIVNAKNFIHNRISIYSNDDHIVPMERLEEYYKEIDAKPILIEGIGHMGKKSGLKELPQVIDIIGEW